MFPEPLIRIELVERDARLEYVHQRVALVLDGFDQDVLGLLDVHGEGPCDEARVQSDSHGQRIERLEEDAVHLDGSHEAFLAGRRGLAFGQAVHHVVVNDMRDVRVSADGMDEVIAALAVHIAVAALRDHGQSGIDGLYRHCRRKGTTVQPVEDVGLEIVRSLCRLADP